jgi:DNA polymerase-3 subunit alpha
MHSEYAIADGIVRIDDAVERAQADGMPALAITDLGNLFGLVKFYEAARARGIKPIIGCDAWIANDGNSDQPYRILLLVANRTGYRQLCELLSRAYRGNMHRGKALLQREWLRDTEGLIALAGGAAGDIGAALLQDNVALARRLAAEWQRDFPQRFYLEIQRYGAADEAVWVERTLDLASELQLPVVATHPVQFPTPDDYTAHEARVCIAEGYVLGDKRRRSRFTREQYFKTQQEMAQLFADVPEALQNTVEIAKRCNVEFELGKARLPVFPTPAGVTLDDYMAQEAQRGLRERLAQLYPDEASRAQQQARYEERLLFEIGTIKQMGFSGYFLIVADFINWAKHNGVPVGPGRGSGAGSLVAYSLGITDLDPLRYGLLFERFLNPERVSMPDFDIDFCQDGRERVIQYVREKYGADSVSQIATFGTMAARAVVRDVGRVLDLPYTFCDQIAKLIPFQPGKLITLQMAREMEPLLKEREEKEEEVRELLALGEKLEGVARNVGMHAGGVLIAPGKLTDFTPLYAAEGTDAAVSQFDKDDVEKIGLVKFDFLGLTTLTILDWALRYCKQLDPAFDLKLEDLPLDDQKVYEIFRKANTVGIFQFESRGMKDLLLKTRPSRLEDLIALNALYRPGPMELIPDYAARKRGEQQWSVPDARLEPMLAETYGIMVYQEQVMQAAQIIGGYTLGGADLLRRAMGKKKPEEMAKQRAIFTAGAQKNGLSEPKATELFDLMEKFAGYGFNKSHSAAYALVAYQTAYFKTHHPAAFMAATMSSELSDTDKVQHFYEDAVANKLKVLPPDVNRSRYRFVPLDAQTIDYGLGAIKGTGEAAIESIIAERKANGAFRDLFDFCRRVDKRLVNRRVVEALARSGALDAFTGADDAQLRYARRASLLASVGAALEAAEHATTHAQQVSLFGGTEAVAEQHKLTTAPAWGLRERLQHEKQALGLYLSGHPFDEYREEVAKFVRNPLSKLVPKPDVTLMAGIVHGFRVQQSRRGRMGILLLDDASARVEVVLYNEVFEAHRNLIQEDALVIIEGRAVEDQFSGGMRITADRLLDLAAARARYARGLRIAMNGEANAKKLALLIAAHSGGTCPVRVSYRNGDASCDFDLGDARKVKLDDGLLNSLRDWLSPENVAVVY